MLKAVIFDVDGTLVDSVDAHAQAWTEILRQFGHPCEFARVRHQIGKGGDQLMKVFLSPDEIRRDGRAIEEARQRLYGENYLPEVKAFPKVRELFERILGDGKKAVLASSAHGEELEACKEKARITDLTGGETSRDDAKRSKPHPDIFQAALDKLGDVAPSEAIVVGDTPWDAIAARHADLRTIGVLCGGFPAAELRDAGCVAIYQGPADLLARYGDSLLAR